MEWAQWSDAKLAVLLFPNITRSFGEARADALVPAPEAGDTGAGRLSETARRLGCSRQGGQDRAVWVHGRGR